MADGAGSLTDKIKAAVAAELDQQRPGLDGLQGIRTLEISVKLPPWPARASRPMTVHVQTRSTTPRKKT